MPLLMPSETQRGQSWLTNFAESERPVATLLLDSLQIASPEDIYHGLKSRIGALAPELNGRAVVIPVLSIEDIERASSENQREQVAARHVAYETFAPGMRGAVTPGSEATVGNVIREFTGEAPGKENGPWLHPSSSIDDLRARNCQAIVLVTDYTSSGRQVIDFAATFPRNAQLRSWRSFDRLEIIVVTHTASAFAVASIENAPTIDHIRPHTPAASFDDAEWSAQERSAIEELCNRYTPPGERKQALGYKASGGLFLTMTSVPNNLPFILRRKSHGWKPFLDGRTMPSDLVRELSGYEARNRDLSEVIRGANQRRVANAIDSGRLRTQSERLVATLALVAHSAQTSTSLAHRLAIPVEEVDALIGFLVKVGFITKDFEITLVGRNELRHAKRLDRVATSHRSNNPNPYYPKMLR
ncbi:hypothetical protein NOU13_28070 [Rhodococcus erythropolis]|uniref:phosphoribosyltransferase-like protein n=1 Tax=Rhodococcus TaxID=1827 RepID=UPI00210E7D39|nr:hypothetical protein [Rhodococcus erythropolis]MCQ4128363.1 hypothetical protein [Rhodococcus erythropolis]